MAGISSRLLRAFARLRWRLLVNGLKSGGRRGDLEQVSRWLATALPVLLAIVMTPVVLAMTAGGALAGYMLGRSPEASATVALVLVFLLIVPLVWLMIRPLLPGDSRGIEGGELPRLLPVPAAFFLRLELAGILLDPMMVLFTPGVLLIAAGAAAAGRFALAGFTLFAAVALLAALAGIGATVALGARFLLRDRRRGEVVTLVVILVLSTAGLLPQLFLPHEPRTPMSSRPSSPDWRFNRTRQPNAVRPPVDVETLKPAFVRLLPSGLFGVALGKAARGDWAAAFARLAALGSLATVTVAITARLHRRLIETPAGSGGTARTASRTAARRRLPLVAPATAAVAAATLRAVLRTVRGRMLLLSPPAFAVLFGLLATRQSHGGVGFLVAPYGAAAFVTLLAVTAVQSIASNQFAIAGRGLVIELLLPLSPRAMVRGRALAFLAASTACLALAVMPLAVVLHSLPAWFFPTLFAGGLAVHLSLTATVAALAAVLPKTADLSAMGKAGNPHPAANLLTLLASMIAVIPPVAWTMLAARVLGNGWLAPVLVTGWAGVCAAGGLALLPMAERLVTSRRENLALIAAGR